MEGLLCPDQDVTLIFELSSDILGVGTQEIHVPIKSAQPESESSISTGIQTSGGDVNEK